MFAPISYTYDHLNQETEEQWFDATGTLTNTINFAYSDRGEVTEGDTSPASGSGLADTSVSLTYDAPGRTSGEGQAMESRETVVLSGVRSAVGVGWSALPNSITHIPVQALTWRVNFFLWGMTQTVGTSNVDVFVTYAEPRNSTPPQAITDQRLTLATKICAGLNDQYAIAQAVQLWLAMASKAGVFPYAASGSTSGTLASTDDTTNADDLWGLLNGSNTYAAQCVQAAEMEVLLLGQLGVHSFWEQLIGTTDLNPDNQVNYRSDAHADQLPVDRHGDQLWFNFNNGGVGVANEGEGGVRVGNRFYSQLATYVGVDSGRMTAEHEVLLDLEKANWGIGNFQRWYNLDTSRFVYAGVEVPP